jgi:hypothetical protein
MVRCGCVTRKTGTQLCYGGMTVDPSSSGQPDGVAFKICPMCDHTWTTRDSFLNDSDLKLVGYQVYFEDLTAGLFLFSHSCEETLAVRVGDFSDLYEGIVFVDRATGSDECREYCLREDELRSCPAKCECAYVREVMQVVREWKKD